MNKVYLEEYIKMYLQAVSCFGKVSNIQDKLDDDYINLEFWRKSIQYWEVEITQTLKGE